MAQDTEQDIELGIVRLEYGNSARAFRAVLTISTGKSHRGGLDSSATVFWVGDSTRQHMFGIGTNGGDFSKRLKVSERTVKATQKAIDRQHAEVFTAEVVGALTVQAKEHYANYVRAGIDGYKNTYVQSSAPATTPA